MPQHNTLLSLFLQTVRGVLSWRASIVRRCSAGDPSTRPTGKVCIGNLTQATGLEMNTRYRVKVLNQYSATFIISDKVYSMVRDATLKFYGINRSGNSESWFHKPSHTKDGAGKFVKGVGAVTGFTPKEGALQGGWYDCGDHLKDDHLGKLLIYRIIKTVTLKKRPQLPDVALRVRNLRTGKK